MIQVQISQPDGRSLRYVGSPTMVNTYGVWSLQLTTPSGDTFTWNVDRVQTASPANAMSQAIGSYNWPA